MPKFDEKHDKKLSDFECDNVSVYGFTAANLALADLQFSPCRCASSKLFSQL